MWLGHLAPLQSEESLHNVQQANGLLVIQVLYWVVTSAQVVFCLSTANCTAVRTMSKKGK
eukprot:4628267-Prorocentrum_lima.AAC.1